jgi:hypothetical protein
MKTLLSILLPAALIWIGCAGKKPPVFDSVPGPSPGLAGGLPAPPAAPPPAPLPVAEPKKPAAKKPELIVTPEKALSGKVVTYNDAGRFVVLDFPGGRLPATDQRMFLYRAGLKVGEVKINDWQRNHYIVADLTSGEAQSGDEVREK